MSTEAEIDDEEGLSSSEEMDPEMEALLYSRIHHQETLDFTSTEESKKPLCSKEESRILDSKANPGVTLLHQTDSGICSPKDSRSSSPLEIEESRLQRLSAPKAPQLTVKEDYDSSSDEDIDNGITVSYENLGKLRESHLAQKKNVPCFIGAYCIEDKSSSSSEDEENQKDLDIQLNICQTKKVSPPSLDALIGESSTSAKQIPDLTPQSWTEQMSNFYNDINHSLKNKTLEDIWKELPDDPNLWEVNLEDRTAFNASYERGRYFKKPSMGGVRCNNCRERGHLSRHCPSPRKPIHCSMCGGSHRETRCDLSMCLRCGEPNRIYTRGCNRCIKLDKYRCSECYCYGHESRTCPNVWRQFHLTTTAEEDLVQVNGFVPPEEKWCPNCAKKGHYLHQCTAYLVSSYPAAIGHVVNYTSWRGRDATHNTEEREERHSNLTRREKFKRKKALAIKRKIFSKPGKKDINKNALKALVSKASKGNNKKPKRKNQKTTKDFIELSSKPRRQRKRAGKSKILRN